MSAVEDLYQQTILDHNKNPRNFGDLQETTHFAEGFNPICGDRYVVRLSVGTDGIINNVRFDGAGCAISKASGSLMTVSLKGKTVGEAKKLFEGFHGLLRGESGWPKELLGKLVVFTGVWKYPARVKCASLAWHAMNSALETGHKVTTE